jgi:c-di-GMP-binding flagellar brake protein YcgR
MDAEASLVLVKMGAALPCRILDLSRGGCRVRTRERFQAGTMVRIEILFTLSGVALRLPGVTQWTDRKNMLGIRFLELSPRKQEQLADLIAELRAETQTGTLPQRSDSSANLASRLLQ